MVLVVVAWDREREGGRDLFASAVANDDKGTEKRNHTCPHIRGSLMTNPKVPTLDLNHTSQLPANLTEFDMGSRGHSKLQLHRSPPPRIRDRKVSRKTPNLPLAACR